MLSMIFLAALVTLSHAATDPQCANYDHSKYGCQGDCIATSDCPGSKYQSGLCPTQANNIKCCFTADTDVNCATYNHPTHGQVGTCMSTSQCPGEYISNLCPDHAADIKCCFTKPTGQCESTCPSKPSTRQELACCILNHDKVTLLDDNKHLNSAGSNDGASAKDNIRDTCRGVQAKRSSYCCSSGCAPGGYTYLSTSVLQYILELLNGGNDLQINSLAGACHSSTSRHYRGTAVDFQIRSKDFAEETFETWMKKCSENGARENLGPGYPGHNTHTHCAFSS